MTAPALPPVLPVALPLLAAALLAALNAVAPRRLADALGIATSVAVGVLCALLLVRAVAASPIVYWFGGWTPRHGVAIGIDFAVDPLGAGLATLAAGLVTAALVFSWRYFEEVGTLFQVLMLVFLGAMAGFCLTGDLFDLFVFFELMSTAGVALAGYEVEERGPLQGALNFGVTNTIGGFCVLTGIALLYGRTGALNLSQIGRDLAGQPVDGLVVVALLLITVGFLVKAAAVPFHFWLPDAHAVAPTPVCILFSGVMVELGLYGALRVYWSVFAPALGQAGLGRAVTGLLVGAGVVTALVGAVECFAQQHLKRLLAFSTISHMGLFLVGAALLTPAGLAGVAVYVAGHGTVKAALFLCVGILMHRFGSVDEGSLFGRGRRLRWGTGLVFGIGGLALAGLPPFAVGLGKSLLETAATRQSLGWTSAVFVVASALTGGAVLRVTGNVFFGWGRTRPPARDDLAGRETEGGRGRTPAVMLAPAVALLLAGLLVGLVPGLAPGAARAAQRFQDAGLVQSVVLGGRAAAPLDALPAGFSLTPDLGSLALSLAATALALGLAGLSLFGVPLPGVPERRLRPLAARALAPLRALQSGHAGDYVAWLVAGAAVYGGVLAVALRAR